MKWVISEIREINSTMVIQPSTLTAKYSMMNSWSMKVILDHLENSFQSKITISIMQG